MKITILQGAFFPVPAILGGAVEKIWYRLGQQFAGMGHAVVHIGRSHPSLNNFEEVSGVQYVRVRGYDTPRSLWLLKLMDLIYTVRAIRKIPVDTDVVITNTFWSPLLLSKQLARKCIVSVERWPKGQMRLYSRTAFLRANSKPVLDAIVNELSQHARSRPVMIPNPLPFALTNVSVKEKDNIVLYVGRVHPEKGLDILVNAFKDIEGNWKLLIVGPWEVGQGGGGKEYLNGLKKVAMAGKGVIEFVGPVYDGEALSQYYRRASIFVYPSVAEKGETFGLAPLEAMAWGCAPIVSELACFHDFIQDDVNGVFFNHRETSAASILRNLIVRLQVDHDLRVGLALQAMKVNESHSCASIALQFVETFNSLDRGNSSQEILHENTQAGIGV